MKKIILLFCILFLLTGCAIEKVNYSNIDELLNDMLSEKVDLSNTYFEGYKYYIPRGLKLANKNDYNAKIVSGKNKYYLYIDVISYYNKLEKDFVESDAYYSKAINYNGKKGYIEITKINNQYFVEIMYNYAKIETLTDESSLTDAIMNACYILSSVTFNDEVIETLVGENALDYQETIFDIFGPHRNPESYL